MQKTQFVNTKTQKTAQVVAWNSLDRRTKISPEYVPEIPDANLLIDRGGNQEVPVPFLAPVDVKNQVSVSNIRVH